MFLQSFQIKFQPSFIRGEGNPDQVSALKELPIEQPVVYVVQYGTRIGEVLLQTLHPPVKLSV